jgi:hypothetical protein
MKIANFQALIKELPYKQQAFDVKRSIWQVPENQELVDPIFDQSERGAEVIRLNRFDVMNSATTEELIVKTLMWGYPTKGRGKNIDNLLRKDNFDKLVKVLDGYQGNEITLSQLTEDMKSIEGLGLSTMTKFTYFLRGYLNGHLAVILDLQIIGVINSGRFEELETLKGIRYDNGIKKYADYLYVIDKLAKELEVEPDQLEYFLFTFGNQLSELSGEECYDET